MVDSEFKRYCETKYTPIPKDDLERIIEDVCSLMELGRDPRQSVRSILEHVAKLIFRRFSFDEIALGLKNHNDGLYRYELTFGYSRENDEAYRKLSYTYEDMVSDERYPHVEIGKISELNPVEVLPESERYLFTRSYQLKFERKDREAFHEGDYIDVWMYDGKGKLIGWIELSKPRGGRQPPRSTIRWIELIAHICGLIIDRKQTEAGRPSR